MDWLRNLFEQISWQYVAWGVGLFVVTFTLSLLVVAVILVRLPATFFLDSPERGFWGERSRSIRWAGVVLKNLAGVMLIVLGIALSLPGVPGQGALTILIGIILVDFPGKRRLERKIVGRPTVLAAINRLRARYNRPPRVVEDAAKPEGEAESVTTNECDVQRGDQK